MHFVNACPWKPMNGCAEVIGHWRWQGIFENWWRTSLRKVQIAKSGTGCFWKRWRLADVR